MKINKTFKKSISILLTVIMILSTMVVGMVTVNSATFTTVYFTPQSVWSESHTNYTYKVNVQTQKVNGDVWLNPPATMTNTGTTVNGGKAVYKATFTDLWNGAQTIQFQRYSGSTHKGESLAISDWTSVTNYNNKLWNGSSWTPYNPEVDYVKVYIVPTDHLDKSYSYYKLNIQLGSTGDGYNEWEIVNLTATDSTVSGKPVYEATLPLIYGGVNEMQLWGCNTSNATTATKQVNIISANTWNATSVFEDKFWNGSSWVTYTPDKNWYVTGRFAIKKDANSDTLTWTSTDNGYWSTATKTDLKFVKDSSNDNLYKLETNLKLSEINQISDNKWYFHIADGTTEYYPISATEWTLNDAGADNAVIANGTNPSNNFSFKTTASDKIVTLWLDTASTAPKLYFTLTGDDPITYTVTIGESVDGDITITQGDSSINTAGESLTVVKDSTVNLSCIPHPGFELENYIKGENTIIQHNTETFKATFTVNGDATVKGKFKKLTYDITPGSISNGTLSVKKDGTETSTYQIGDTLTFNVTPDSGYVLDGDITVTSGKGETTTVTNGGSLTIDENYINGITISANFTAESTDKVEVPDVAYKTQDEAIAILAANGLNNYSVVEVNDAATAGTVISSNPEAGQMVDKNSNVILYVSNGVAEGEVIDSVKIMFKGTNLTSLTPSLTINGQPCEQPLVRDAYIGTYINGSYRFYWWSTTIKNVVVGKTYTFNFKTSGSSMNATADIDFSVYDKENKTIYLAVDNMQTGTVLENISDKETAKKAFRSSANMITNVTSQFDPNKTLAAAMIALLNADGTTTTKKYSIGDANADGSVNIKDATTAQMMSAGYVQTTSTNSILGDFDISGDVNIKDATGIQTYIVYN